MRRIDAPCMNLVEAVTLVVAAALAAYLVYALLHGELH